MFVGHLAIAFGARSLHGPPPLSLLIAASFGVDLVWPVFLLLGLEVVQVDPGNTAFTALAFVSYPWSHSLLLGVGWATLAGGFAYRFSGSVRGGVVIGLVVVSHWVVDWVTHRPDLPLWPGGPLVGLGLWNSIAGTLVVEGLLLASGVVMFYRSITFRSRAGHVAVWSLLALTTFIWVSQPWAPPAPGPTAVAIVGLVLWLLPLWGSWIERNVIHDHQATPIL